MRKLHIASTLGECDVLPDGSFAVCVPGKGIETHFGLVPLPPWEPSAVLYPRITNEGRFTIAGQAQSTVRGAQAWNADSGGGELAKPPFGTQPVIWDNRGTLHIADSSVGSQGYRYVCPDDTPTPNRVITGDATLAPFHGINKWTDLSFAQNGTLLLGQANWTTAIVLWDGRPSSEGGQVYRLVEAVAGEFPIGQRKGALVAICYATPTGASLLWCQLRELYQLPVFSR